MSEENNGFTEELQKKKLSIYKSLAAFQQECPVIHKATKGYGYTYADLPTIFGVINPLLKQNGLGFTQLIQENVIVTILFHIETGETIESITNVPQDVKLSGMNDFQVLGSAVTYIRRYALSSMLGIVTDKDTDADGKQDPKQQPKKVTPKKVETKPTNETPKLTMSTDFFNKYIKALKNDIAKLDAKACKEKYNLTDEQIKEVDAV